MSIIGLNTIDKRSNVLMGNGAALAAKSDSVSPFGCGQNTLCIAQTRVGSFELSLFKSVTNVPEPSSH
jgi:hypothetical protein